MCIAYNFTDALVSACKRVRADLHPELIITMAGMPLRSHKIIYCVTGQSLSLSRSLATANACSTFCTKYAPISLLVQPLYIFGRSARPKYESKTGSSNYSVKRTPLVITSWIFVNRLQLWSLEALTRRVLRVESAHNQLPLLQNNLRELAGTQAVIAVVCSPCKGLACNECTRIGF